MDKSHAPVALSAETKALLSRTPAVIEPGHTFESVTETIGHVVLSKRTPIGWFLGFFIAFILLMVLNMSAACWWRPPTAPCRAISTGWSTRPGTCVSR